MRIIVEQTANTTPERSWDFRAWVDGQEEEGPTGIGKTELDALRSLVDQLEDV